MQRKVASVAIKLFGVYLFILFLRTIPFTASYLFLDHGNYITIKNQVPLFIANAIYSFSYVIIALVFIIKTSLVVKFLKLPDEYLERPGTDFKPFALSLGLTLLGVYFLVSSLPNLVSYAFILMNQATGKSSYGSLMTLNFIESVVSLGLAMILIVKNKAIVSRLSKITEKNNGPSEITRRT